MPAHNTTKFNGGLPYDGMKKRGRPRKNSSVIFGTGNAGGEKNTKPPSAKQARFTDQLTKAMADQAEIYLSYAHDGPRNLKDYEKNPRKILPLNFGSSSPLCTKGPLFKYFEATCFNENPPATKTFATRKVLRIESTPWLSNGISCYFS